MAKISKKKSKDQLEHMPPVKEGDLVEVTRLSGYEGRTGIVLSVYRGQRSLWESDYTEWYAEVSFTDGEEITFYAFYLSRLSEAIPAQQEE
jgi:hypothetical protein